MNRQQRREFEKLETLWIKHCFPAIDMFQSLLFNSKLLEVNYLLFYQKYLELYKLSWKYFTIHHKSKLNSLFLEMHNENEFEEMFKPEL